ncbi:MAG: Transcriptional regulator, TrmB [uncultured bacterium]|nr:MAG: Transcriptional regulator, TrmB [uncultured bacterium]
MAIEQKLHDMGLSSLETRVYLFLLEHGTSSPPQISKGTKIARSNAHYLLRELVQMGLINRQQKGKRFVYAPTDPSAALIVFDRKRKAMEEAINDLRALHKKSTNKPIVKFYEGIEEIKQIYEDILKTKVKEVLAFASTARLFAKIPDYFQTRFQKVLVKREVFLRAILSYESGKKVAPEQKEQMRPYYDYRLIDKKYGDLPTDFLVWDDSLAIIVIDDPVFGTVLENKHLADTYRAQFENMWQALSKTDD